MKRGLDGEKEVHSNKMIRVTTYLSQIIAASYGLEG